jgi:hypothetical protein
MADVFQFTAETNIETALSLDDRVVHALRSLGLKCVDKRDEMCPAASVETLAEAALYHEIPLERILATLNQLRIVPNPPAADAPPA